MSQAPDWYADYYTQLNDRDEYESLVRSLHDNVVRLSHSSPWSIAPRPSSIFHNQARYQNYNWPATSSATTDSFNPTGIHRVLPVWTYVLPNSAPKVQTLIAPLFNQQTPWPFGLPNFDPNSTQHSAQGNQVAVSENVQQPTVFQPQSMTAAYPWHLPPLQLQLQPQEHQSASAVYVNQANIVPEHSEVHSDNDSSEIDVVGVDIDEPLDLSVVRRDMNEQHQPQVVPQGSKSSSFFNPAGPYRPLPFSLQSSVPLGLSPIALPLYKKTQWPTQMPLGDLTVGPNSGQQDAQVNQIGTTASGPQQTVVQSQPMLEIAAAFMQTRPTQQQPLQQSLQMQPGLIGNANQSNNMHDLASVHTQGHSSDVPLDLSVAQPNMCEKSQPQGAHQPQINELANNMQQQQRGPPRRPPIFEPMFGEISCVSCNYVFRQYKDLWLHMQREHPRLFARCGTIGCRLVLPNAAHLIDHYNNDHPGTPIRFRCRFCEANFGSSRDLENHFQYFHHRGRFFCTHHECDFVAEFQSDVQRHYFANHVQHTIAKQLTN